MGKAEAAQFIIITVIFAVVLVGFITGIILFIFQFRKKKLEYDRDRNTLLETHRAELAALQLEIQQQTMQHIGRELHDDVGQQLTLASIYAQQLQHESACPGNDGRLEQVTGLINNSLGGIRNLSRLLTDPAVEQGDLVELLRHECEKVNGLNTCKAVLETVGTDDGTIGPLAKLVLLRLAQESIQNSLKHARCSHIYIRLEVTEQVLKLGIQDDGGGFNTARPEPAGSGLRNMKKRAAILNASFSVTSSIGGGTLVMLTAPRNNLKL